MNLISIRFRQTVGRTVLEFRHRLVGEDGRVSTEWGPWQIAYLMEDGECRHMQKELPGLEGAGGKWDQIYVQGYWRQRRQPPRTSKRRRGPDG